MDSAFPIDHAEQFDAWLAGNGQTEREAWVVIYKKVSGKQTVTFDQLLEVAICHGWVDVKTKSLDDERYAIRFVPRRPKSNWSPTNRAIVKRLISEGRIRPAGTATLPEDLWAEA